MKFVIPQSTLNRIIARWLNENIGKVIPRDNTQALDHPPRFEKFENTIYSKTGEKLFDVLLIQGKISDETKKIVYVNYTDEVDKILKDLPKPLTYKDVTVGFEEYFKNPSLRSFELNMDPHLTGTVVAFVHNENRGY